MAQVAVEIAQTGVDIFKAPGFKKTFSSLMESLPIAKKVLINTDHVSAVSVPLVRTKIYEHGLGYVPIFIPMLQVNSSPKQYMMYTQNQFLSVDENFVYSMNLGVSAPTENHLLLIIARPLLERYDSPVGSEGLISGSAESTTILKIAKRNKSIDSTDERDAVVNTDFKTLLVHKQGEIDYIRNHAGNFQDITGNVAGDFIFMSSTSGYTSGNTVGFATDGTLPAPLQDRITGKQYFVRVINATDMYLYETFDDYQNDVRINITTAGTGSFMIAFSNQQGIVEHNLGYPPLFLVYYGATAGDIAGTWQALQGAPNSEVVTGAHRANKTKLFIGGANIPETRLAYVIFKDPYAL